MLFKGREDLGHVPPSELARMLQERRGVIQDYLDSARELRDVILQYENKFDMRSADMIEAVSTGAITETLEVSKWLTAYERYRRLSADWPVLAAS